MILTKKMVMAEPLAHGILNGETLGYLARTANSSRPNLPRQGVRRPPMDHRDGRPTKNPMEMGVRATRGNEAVITKRMTAILMITTTTTTIIVATTTMVIGMVNPRTRTTPPATLAAVVDVVREQDL